MATAKRKARPAAKATATATGTGEPTVEVSEVEVAYGVDTRIEAAIPAKAPAFESDFEKISLAVMAEWPAVDADALSRTRGDVDAIARLVSQATLRTRAWARRRLLELDHSPRDLTLPKARGPELLEKLERRTRELVDELRDTHLVEVRGRIQRAPLKHILIAAGAAFILGFFFGGLRRR